MAIPATVASTVLMSDSFPRTRETLLAEGHDVRTVGISEFLRAEGGVTCLSLIFEDGPIVDGPSARNPVRPRA